MCIFKSFPHAYVPCSDRFEYYLSLLCCEEEIRCFFNEFVPFLQKKKKKITIKGKLIHRRSALFLSCNVWLVQQDSTAYEKEKDIISVVSRLTSVTPCVCSPDDTCVNVLFLSVVRWPRRATTSWPPAPRLFLPTLLSLRASIWCPCRPAISWWSPLF